MTHLVIYYLAINDTIVTSKLNIENNNVCITSHHELNILFCYLIHNLIKMAVSPYV